MSAIVATNTLSSTRKEYKLIMNTKRELVYPIYKCKKPIKREKWHKNGILKAPEVTFMLQFCIGWTLFSILFFKALVHKHRVYTAGNGSLFSTNT